MLLDTQPSVRFALRKPPGSHFGGRIYIFDGS